MSEHLSNAETTREESMGFLITQIKETVGLPTGRYYDVISLDSTERCIMSHENGTFKYKVTSILDEDSEASPHIVSAYFIDATTPRPYIETEGHKLTTLDQLSPADFNLLSDGLKLLVRAAKEKAAMAEEPEKSPPSNPGRISKLAKKIRGMFVY
ncbi:TPA: hypothetical protein EYO12_02935 [Candidatus Saccharibacteria bacterium]|nr:hypothetical protein [Candidatus Saccharibacteria bacterium]HIO88007.1 hypothetical protein [Candidatus Saccharibacteria bacterium]